MAGPVVVRYREASAHTPVVTVGAGASGFGVTVSVFRPGAVMVLSADVWMEGGLSAAVQGIAPAALCLPGDIPPHPLSALVAWLPDLHSGLPGAVLKLASLLHLCDRDTLVLLLAREVPDWLYRTLKNLVPGARILLSRVQCLPDSITAEQLQLALLGSPARKMTLPEAGLNTCCPGLSRAELLVLDATLRGENTHTIASLAGRSVATVHRLRWQAMQKAGGLRVKNLRYPFRRRG